MTQGPQTPGQDPTTGIWVRGVAGVILLMIVVNDRVGWLSWPLLLGGIALLVSAVRRYRRTQKPSAPLTGDAANAPDADEFLQGVYQRMADRPGPTDEGATRPEPTPPSGPDPIDVDIHIDPIEHGPDGHDRSWPNRD